VTVLINSDHVIGGASGSETLYVTSDASAVPMQVSKLNIRTGIRQPFVTISPTDPAGVFFLSPPIFAADEKRYVETHFRILSVLYVADGLN